MVRIKFAGLIRSLWRRNDSEQAPAGPGARPVASSSPRRDSPPRTGSATAAAPVSAAPVSLPPGENEIALPLASIIAGLPMDLRAKIMTVPPAGQIICLPVETIIAQLAFGAVKISFGELRELADGVFAKSGSEQDGKLINLPLNEILSRINPALLVRQSGNKVEVSDEISGPFNGLCNGVMFTDQPLKSSKPAPQPAEPVVNRMNPLVEPSAPIAFRPPPGMETQSKPSINGATNGHRMVPLPSHTTPPPTALKIPSAPAPVPPPRASVPAAPRPEPAQLTFPAALAALSENWPDELKLEIVRGNLASLSVPLDAGTVEAGLKRGRIVMSWKALRSLAKPGSMPSPNDNLELDLPLKVVAPLFFAAKRNAPQSRKVTKVSEEIPNLFFGFPKAAPGTPAVQPATSIPMADPAARPVEKPVEKRNGNSNFFVRTEDGEVQNQDEAVYLPPAVPQTDFTSRRALPKDVVGEAAKLPGVAGALVTLPDGLRVASEVTAGLNPDTLAAFIPQIYERMNQSTRELRMGVLNNVAFTVGSVPWKIFRVNSVYFAVFGQAGASLPSVQLARLAGELDRKKQQ